MTNKGSHSTILLWLAFVASLCGILLDIYNKTVVDGFVQALTTFKYFTLQSNLLVVLVSSGLLFLKEGKVKTIAKNYLGAVTSYILLTGIVYLIILEPIYELYGRERIASVLLHYVVPPAVLAYWLLNEKRRYQFKEILKWLCYPVIFMLWGLLLAFWFEDYLYPFFDIAQYGAFVAIYLVLVAIGFLAMILLLFFINNFYLTPHIPERRGK